MLVWQQQRLFEERWEDGRNPAPPGMYKNPVNNGMKYLSTGAGFCPSTVWVLLGHDFTIVNSRLVTSKYLSGKVSPWISGTLA